MSEGVPEGVRAQGSKRERRRQQESWSQGAKERGSEGVVRGARGSEAAGREESSGQGRSSGQALASVLPAGFRFSPSRSLWLESLASVLGVRLGHLFFVLYHFCSLQKQKQKQEVQGKRTCHPFSLRRAISFPCALRSLPSAQVLGVKLGGDLSCPCCLVLVSGLGLSLLSRAGFPPASFPRCLVLGVGLGAIM